MIYSQIVTWIAFAILMLFRISIAWPVIMSPINSIFGWVKGIIETGVMVICVTD